MEDHGAGEGFRMEVLFHENEVTRRLHRHKSSGDAVDLVESLFGDEQFCKRFADALSSLHPNASSSHAVITSALKKGEVNLWRKTPTLQWYWAEFFAHIRDRSKLDHGPFTINIKACKERYFYSLTQTTRSREAAEPQQEVRFLTPPFFEKSAPPENSSDVHDRGILDTVLFLAADLIRPEVVETVDALAEYLSWFSVSLECTVVDVSEAGALTLNVVPRVNQPDQLLHLPSGGSVLMASRNVRDAVKDLSKIWLNPQAKSVLISAWTGSGKEVLVGLLEEASMARGRLSFAAPSVPNLDALADRIATRFDDLDGSASLPSKSEREPRPSEPNPPESPRTTVQPLGEAVQRSYGYGKSLLFIDEIHHDAASALRPGMLRLLEDGVLDGTSSTGSLDLRNTLLVFAASEHPKRLRAEVQPRDIWNRIEHTIVLKHPLNVRGVAERKAVLSSYFLFFWSTLLPDAIASLPAVAQPRVRAAFYSEEPGFHPSLDSTLAEIFADFLASPLVPIISVRFFRSLTKRLAVASVSAVRVESSTSDSVASQRDLVKSRFTTWLEELSDELLSDMMISEAF